MLREMIEGMQELINRLQPLLFIENRSKEIAEKICGLQGMSGYNYYAIKENDRTIVKISSPVHIGAKNILACPKGDSGLIKTLVKEF
jgi:hypothetical protein